MKGGKEEPIGNNLIESEIQCAKAVRTTYPDATGATYGPDTKGCWAEFGDQIGASVVYRACLFNSKWVLIIICKVITTNYISKT